MSIVTTNGGSNDKKEKPNNRIVAASTSSNTDATAAPAASSGSGGAISIEKSGHFYPILPYSFKAVVDMTGWHHSGGEDELIGLVRDGELKAHVAELMLPIIPTQISLATSSQAHTNLTLAASLPSTLSFSTRPPPQSAAHAAAATTASTSSTTDDSSRSSSSAYRRMWAAFPAPSQFIGTTLPFITFHIKNMARKVAVEVEVMDTTGTLRVIQASNAQSVARIRTHSCTLPLQLTSGWNRVVLDLRALTQRVFTTEYKHATRVKVYANCRLRRIFFSDASYKNDDLPPSLQLFPPSIPLTNNDNNTADT